MSAERAKTAEDSRPRGLGRGLSALLGEEGPAANAAPSDASKPRTLPIAFLKPNRFQPRHDFREAEMQELAASIRERGILQPIVVRPTGQANSYEIVAGERRWRAAQIAKLHEVPVTVREFSDPEALEVAIVENVQRSDLNVMEEAGGYHELMTRFGHTQEQLSELIGKSRSHVANTLRLLKLPESVRILIIEGKLSAGHARTLVGLANAEEVAKEIIAGTLNVRQAEKKARGPKRTKGKVRKDADTKSMEEKLTSLLGLTVLIDHKGARGGEISIRYKTLEQLDDVCRRLTFYGEAD
jgi:ParB family transcriptional regulator, chromosome partitioning protein